MITYLCTIILVTMFCFLCLRAKKETSLLDKNDYPRYSHNGKKLYLFIIIALLIFVAGCRYRVGTDYKSYMKLYEDYIQLDFKALLMKEEPILPALGIIAHYIFGSYKGMFFLASIFTIGIALVSTYKETNDILFVTLLYIFVGCWHGSFNGVRQYMAAAVIFAGRKYIIKREFFKYLLVVFFAFLCHQSAAIFILLYFLYSTKLSFFKIFTVASVALVLSLNTDYLFGLMGWLTDSEIQLTEYATRAVNILRVIVGVVPAVLAVYIGYNKKLNRTEIFYVYILIVNAAIWVATANSAYLARFGGYTSMFVPLALSYLMNKVDKESWVVVLFRIFVIIAYALFWSVSISSSATLYEYEWFFGK